jgi:hypothetical protein
MARKRISADKLNWIVLRELRENFQLPERIALAVVPDESRGWRILIQKDHGRGPSTAGFTRSLALVQKRLGKRYALDDE